MDKGSLVNNLKKLNSRSCDNERNGFTDGIPEQGTAINLCSIRWLMKDGSQHPCLPKIEGQDSHTSQHTDKSGKSWLGNRFYIVARTDFHDEKGCQQHPNNPNDLLRNLTDGIRLEIVKTLEKASDNTHRWENQNSPGQTLHNRHQVWTTTGHRSENWWEQVHDDRKDSS